MKITVPSGKYILAVSGGVDSMALLDLLAKNSKRPNSRLELVVAHFNHGIRPDAKLDEQLVTKTASQLGLKIESGRAKLGANASEDQARVARYKFLHSVRKKHRAKAIITAHHQDDLIETVFLNLLRGSGRRGISSIADNPEILRPLLAIPKTQVIKYAKSNNLKWREDVSNQDTVYLRNYLRIALTPKLTSHERQVIIKNAEKVAKNNKRINHMIATISHHVNINGSIDRHKFTMLPPEIGRELIMEWLRSQDTSQFDRQTIDRLYINLKTAPPGSRHNVYNGLELSVGKRFAKFETTG